VDAAARDGRTDRVRFAGDHVASLEKRVSRLTVAVAPEAAATPGLEVALDGAPLPRALWGAAQPVDPGAHEVTARADGKAPWRTSVRVADQHDSATVTVGALDDPGRPEAATAGGEPVLPDTADPGRGRRTAGYLVGGLGIAALGVGAYFGVSALSKNADAKSQCSPSMCTSPSAVAENHDAQTAANVANITIGVGIAALAVGAYLVLTAPHATRTAVTVRLSPRIGGLALDGTF
jgi:hypothetical protein